jgi:hypothetical protein
MIGMLHRLRRKLTDQYDNITGCKTDALEIIKHIESICPSTHEHDVGSHFYCVARFLGIGITAKEATSTWVNNHFYEVTRQSPEHERRSGWGSVRYTI